MTLLEALKTSIDSKIWVGKEKVFARDFVEMIKRATFSAAHNKDESKWFVDNDEGIGFMLNAAFGDICYQFVKNWE